MVVEVNNQKYQLKFGYGALRNICKMYGYEKVSGYDKLVKKLKLDKMTDPSFEQLDFVGDLILAAITNVTPQVEITSADVLDSVMSGKIDTGEVMQVFADSLPKQNNQPQKKGN